MFHIEICKITNSMPKEILEKKMFMENHSMSWRKYSYLVVFFLNNKVNLI